MRKDLVDLTLVVDRSGSMQTIRDDAEGGINAFIEDQAGEEGEAVLTLVEFDSEYEFLHRAVAIKDVPPYVLTPRGSTALLDAVGRAINETGLRLAKIPESDRPGLVVFVVMTDGQENSSREFKLDDVRKMIDRQQTTYNWQFTFLGADAAAFNDAAKMGSQREQGMGNSPKQRLPVLILTHPKKLVGCESNPLPRSRSIIHLPKMSWTTCSDFAK